MRERPVRDDCDLRAARDEVASGRFAHLPGAEQQDAATVELPEHLLGERRRGRGHGRRALGDRRLAADSPAGVERLAEEAVEERSGGACLERRPYLSQDLSFAGHERVEPAGDAEEVQRRGFVPEPVQRRRELARGLPCEACDRLHRLLLDVLGRREVELRPVAGREHDRLAVQPCRQLTAGLQVERDALTQLDRSAVVRDAGKRELHAK